jgi:hypothetical protein
MFSVAIICYEQTKSNNSVAKFTWRKLDFQKSKFSEIVEKFNYVMKSPNGLILIKMKINIIHLIIVKYNSF